jgi:hypothetical protein
MIEEHIQYFKKVLPSGVQLVAVSKFHPVEQIMEAYAAGQRVFAESRPQELAAKVPQMPADVQWHFIGHLQTNKLKLVLPYVSLVQSVDSLHLLEAIKSWALVNNRTVDVLLELHLGAEETKQGFTEAEILSIIAGEASPAIRVCGLMGMATNTEDMSVVERDFERIEALFRKIQGMGFPDFTELSIGMSGDWPLAVRHGATMVRIGTDIFGPRV